MICILTEEYGSLKHKNPAKGRVYKLFLFLFLLPCFHSVKRLFSSLKLSLKIVQDKDLSL